MQKRWENNGLPLEGGEHDGQLALSIYDGERLVSRFYGKDKDEVADKLADAQVKLTARLDQVRKSSANESLTPARPTTSAQPRALSADERFGITSDLNDPARAPEAIARVVESVTGVPLKKVGEALNADEERELNARIAQATQEFVRSTPEYYPDPKGHNRERIVNFILRAGGDLGAVNNYHIAFNQLTEDGLIVQRPVETETLPLNEEQPEKPNGSANANEPMLTQGNTRPRGAVGAQGIRNAEAGGQPAARRGNGKYSREELLRIARHRGLYREKLQTDPAFEKEFNAAMEDAGFRQQVGAQG